MAREIPVLAASAPALSAAAQASEPLGFAEGTRVPPDRLRVSLVLLLALQGMFALVPAMWGWGVDPLRFLHPVAGGSLWGAAALSLLPAVSRRLTTALERVGDFLATSKLAPSLAFLAGALLIAVLPDRVWFVGDFLLRQGSIESDHFSGVYRGALPLDRFLHFTLLRPFGSGSAAFANLALRTLGALEAGLFAVFALHFARSLPARGALASAAGGVVFFGGYLTVFAGLGKPADEMCVLICAVAAFGVRNVRGEGSLLPLGLTLAVALLVHRSAALLLPVWMYAAGAWLVRRRGTGAWRRPGAWASLLIPLAVAVAALPRIVAVFGEYDLTHHLLTLERRAEGGFVAALLSRRHLLDLLNILLALSPLAIVIPILLAGRVREAMRRPQPRFLGLLAASLLPILLFVQPQHGIFRDWDVFAPAAVALSAFAACLVVESLRSREDARALALPVLIVVVALAVPWLALQSSDQRGLARVRAYLMEPPGAAAADRAQLWDFLAARYLRLRQWPEAADAAGHAAELAPHRRIFLMWGVAETMKEDHAAAAMVYRKLLRRDPEDPLAWLGLAGAARRSNDEQELLRALERLSRYGPDSPEARQIQRHLSYFPEVGP